MDTLTLVWSLVDGTGVFPQSLLCTYSPRSPEKELCQGGVWRGVLASGAWGRDSGPALLQGLISLSLSSLASVWA